MSCVVAIPSIVIALIVGIALHSLFANTTVIAPGMKFCVRTVLRCAIALMGLRIALADIVALGAANAVLVIAAMVLTLLSGFLFARKNGHTSGFGALVGSATAICAHPLP